MQQDVPQHQLTDFVKQYVSILRNRKIPTMTDLHCLTFLDTFRVEKKMITFNK